MGNIAQWVRDAERDTGDYMTVFVIGMHDDDRWSYATDRTSGRINRVLGRDEAMSILDTEFDEGFGGADCFPMYAWSERFVWFIHEYDGATSLCRVPRHPVECEPEFSGE